MWSPDVSGVPPQKALFQFTLVALGFVGFAFFTKYALVPDKPAVPREYPFSGLVVELGGLEENKVITFISIYYPDHVFTIRNRQEKRNFRAMKNRRALYLAFQTRVQQLFSRHFCLTCDLRFYRAAKPR